MADSKKAQTFKDLQYILRKPASDEGEALLKSTWLNPKLEEPYKGPAPKFFKGAPKAGRKFNRPEDVEIQTHPGFVDQILPRPSSPADEVPQHSPLNPNEIYDPLFREALAGKGPLRSAAPLTPISPEEIKTPEPEIKSLEGIDLSVEGLRDLASEENPFNGLKGKFEDALKNVNAAPLAAFIDSMRNGKSNLAGAFGVGSGAATLPSTLFKQNQISARQEDAQRQQISIKLMDRTSKDVEPYYKILPAFSVLEEAFKPDTKGMVRVQRVEAALSLLAKANGEVGTQTDKDTARQLYEGLTFMVSKLKGFFDRGLYEVPVTEVIDLIDQTNSLKSAWAGSLNKKLRSSGAVFKAIGADPEMVDAVTNDIYQTHLLNTSKLPAGSERSELPDLTESKTPAPQAPAPQSKEVNDILEKARQRLKGASGGKQ